MTTEQLSYGGTPLTVRDGLVATHGRGPAAGGTASHGISRNQTGLYDQRRQGTR